ncbi:unnamed protein product [Calypogeia fissa]
MQAMEETMTSIDGGINTTAGAYFYQGQSFEELKQLLVCASMELKSQREATKAQEQLHDARVRHLEELLKTARRERDEFRDQCMQLKGRFLSNSRSMNSGLSQEPQLRTRSGLQPLESVASMTEPSRATLTEVHRKLQLEYVSSMTEPTRDTLTEVHRKMQEQQQQQQQQQQQLELQQLDMQQLQHHMDLQHQHSNHSQLDLRPSPAASHIEFQSQHHQLEELRQHFEIQPKDHLQGQQQLHMDMVMNERQAEVSHSGGDVDNGSDAKSTTWNEFPSSVHMDIHSSNAECLILDSPEHMHITKLTQGLPTPHVEQRSSPHLDDLQQQLQQQQQHHQDDNMQIHLQQQQQESEEILSHMQQGQTADAHAQALQLQGEHKLRRQLSKRQLSGVDGLGTPISGGGLQGTNDVVMNIPVLQQQQLNVPWPAGLMGMTSAPLSNGPNGISEQLMQSSCLQGGSVVASILSPLERFGDSQSSSMLLPRPVHLPEPPEADPQVMLNSLPEKGKLLQAVIQAGPLLQSLLLAGPLPQWRHPPPPLDPEEIPRVSMGATGGIMPPGEQGMGGLMPSHGSASSLEQVMRLSAPLQSSPSQNGFCH